MKKKRRYLAQIEILFFDTLILISQRVWSFLASLSPSKCRKYRNSPISSTPSPIDHSSATSAWSASPSEKKRKKKGSKAKNNTLLAPHSVWLAPGCQSRCTLPLKWLPWFHLPPHRSPLVTRQHTQISRLWNESDRWTASGCGQRNIRPECLHKASNTTYKLSRKNISHSLCLCWTLLSCLTQMVTADQLNDWQNYISDDLFQAKIPNYRSFRWTFAVFFLHLMWEYLRTSTWLND